MPPGRSAPKILQRAGELRKQTTPAEKKLWARLRLLREEGLHFRRQHDVSMIGVFGSMAQAPERKRDQQVTGYLYFRTNFL
jgi:hypothetical protein